MSGISGSSLCRPLPGLRKAADALASTAHAVGYSLLPSGLKKESPAFYQKAPTLGLHAKPVTAEM